MIYLKEIFLLLSANSIIAAFLTSVGFGEGFGVNFVVSQCIGFACYICVKGMYTWAAKLTPVRQLTAIILALAGGVAAGILAGGFFAKQDPLYFFSGNQWFFFKVYSFSILFGTVISSMFISQRQLVQAKTSAQEEKIRRLAQEKEIAETNLKMLQAQIEPHFLFNTLANVVSLIENDKEKAKKMLLDLTEFLRTSLGRTRAEKVTLGQELAMIRSYLNIIKVRMGERLDFRIEMDQALLGHSLPPMLLQPLVENSIKHGLEPKVEGGQVLISGKAVGDVLRIEINDTGLGMQDNSGGGVGLANIRKRLQSLYHGQGKLFFENNSPSGLKAILEIPYHAV